MIFTITIAVYLNFALVNSYVYLSTAIRDFTYLYTVFSEF